MDTLAQVFAAIDRVRPALASRHLRRIGVFGSIARGEARADSDVDVLVELTEEGDLFEALVWRAATVRAIAKSSPPP